MAFTYFFRDSFSLELAADHLIPESMGRSKIKIWDAGCAIGAEPYTMIIILAEKMGKFSFKNVKVTATDINKDFGKIIKDGVYPLRELERIPSEIFQKHFISNDTNQKEFKINENIKNRINFYHHDLLSLQPVDKEFSLIICKNVLLHFSPEERIKVLEMFHRSLTKGGYIVMEHTQKMPEDIGHLFDKVTNNAQLFKKSEV